MTGRSVTVGSDVEIVDSRRFGGAFVLDQLWERVRHRRGARSEAAAAGASMQTSASGCCSRSSRSAASSRPPSWPRCTLGDRARRSCRLSRRSRRRRLCGDGLPVGRAPEIAERDLRSHGEPVEPVLRHDLRRHLLHLLRARRRRWLGRARPRRRRRAEKAAGQKRGRRWTGPRRGGDPPVLQALQGPPSRPAPGRARHGRHRRGDPGPLLDLPGHHLGPGDHQTIKDDLAGWMLNRVVWVADSGFNSAANRGLPPEGRRPLHRRRAVRGGTARGQGRTRPCRALPRRRRQPGGEGGPPRRRGTIPALLVCHNPEVAARDREVRANLVAYLHDQIAGTDDWTQQRRDELVGELRTTPALYRLVRRTKDGSSASTRGPSRTRSASTASSCSAPPTTASPRPTSPSPTSSSTEVERGWRDLKGALGCARSSTTARTASAPTSSSAGWRSCSSARSRTPPATPGATSATSSTACTSSPSRPPKAASPSARRRRPAKQQILAALDIAEPARFHDFELPTPAA